MDLSGKRITYNHCGICGHQPQTKSDEPNYAPIRWWDPDDGWLIGSLCRQCSDEFADVQPSPDDYAYALLDSYPDSNTDEDEIEAL